MNTWSSAAPAAANAPNRVNTALTIAVVALSLLCIYLYQAGAPLPHAQRFDAVARATTCVCESGASGVPRVSAAAGAIATAGGDDGDIGIYSHGLPSFAVVGNTFFGSLPLFRVDQRTGKLVPPPGVKRLIIDIGTFDYSEFVPLLETQPDLMVIGFEPAPPAFARHMQKVRHDRFIEFPMAVAKLAPNSSYLEFGIAKEAMCNSIRRFNTKFDEGVLNRCAQQTDQVVVAAISLEAILSYIPESVNVDVCKIDAQGADLAVAQSSGSQLRRCDYYRLECQDYPPGHKKLIYDGASTRDQVREWFASRGYTETKCDLNRAEIKEYNCEYKRNDPR